MGIMQDNEFDVIEIDELSIRGLIGIFPWERDQRQEILISLRMFADTTPAAASDDIKDALDYKQITKDLIQFVQGSKFFLVEKLAEEISNRILQDERVQRVVVRVEKPGALRFAKSVAVQISRSKS